MKNERLARSRSPPRRALLNCSSDLSCLEPRINREAINLSSRGEWEEGLGRGGASTAPSVLDPSSAQHPQPHPIPIGPGNPPPRTGWGQWGCSGWALGDSPFLLASLQVLLMILIKSKYVVRGYITTPSQGVREGTEGLYLSGGMRAQDPRAGQITPEGCAHRMEITQGAPGKPEHQVDPEASCGKGRPALCSVAPSCSTLCDTLDCSLPGFPVLHHLPEFAQTHHRQVGDAIQPPHPLSPSSPSP